MSESKKDDWGALDYERVHSLTRQPSTTIVNQGNVFSALNDPQAYVLELGAGTGVMTQVLSDRYPTTEILATDLSDGMLAKLDALHLPNVQLLKLDANDLSSVENENFTHIFTSATIQFCDDPTQPLREASRVLKKSKERRRAKDSSAPAGVFAVSTWNKLDAEKLFRALYEELGIPEKMVTPFDTKKWPQDEDGVKAEFERAGFQDVKTVQEWMSDGRDLDAMLEHTLVWDNPAAVAMRTPAVEQFGQEKCAEVMRRLFELGARGQGAFGKSSKDFVVGQVIGIGIV